MTRLFSLSHYQEMLVSPISFIKVQPTDSSGGDNAAAKHKATEKKRRASRSHTASVTNSDSAVKLAENILPRNFEGEGSLPSEAGTDSLKEPTSSIDMQEAIQEEVQLALAFFGETCMLPLLHSASCDTRL